jgi:hypothetical protein
MFIATILTRTKLWNQPRYLPTNEWIKNMRYICIMEYYSQEELNYAIFRKMDRTRDQYMKRDKPD